MDEMKSITLDDVSAAQKHFAADRANLVAKNAATAAGYPHRTGIN